MKKYLLIACVAFGASASPSEVEYCENQGEIYMLAATMRQNGHPMENVRKHIAEVKDIKLRKSFYVLMNRAYSEPQFSSKKLAHWHSEKERNIVVTDCYASSGLL